jgi:nitrogen regulatory protein P-II 1
MKKIEAIIREEKLDAVKKALEEKGFVGLTVSRVSGRGKQKGLALQWRVGEYRVELLPKLKLEIVTGDEDSALVIDTICQVARTGVMGDGMIFVLPVDDVIRVRTNEKGEDTLSRKELNRMCSGN